jgi:hypothetical protein
MNLLKVKGLFRIVGPETLCSAIVTSKQHQEEFVNGMLQSHQANGLPPQDAELIRTLTVASGMGTIHPDRSSRQT